MSISDIQFKFDIDPSFNQIIKEEIATRAINEIKKRTQSGISSTGSKFPKYEPEYVKEKGSGKVNLTLTEEMLNDMEVVEIGDSYITIGYTEGNESAGKAEGNQLGTYGQDNPIPGKARPFIGLPKRTLDLIISEVKETFIVELEDSNIQSFLTSKIGESKPLPSQTTVTTTADRTELFIDALIMENE